MRKKSVGLTILLFLIIFFSHDAFSAWTQPKGHSYNQLTLSYYRTVKKFTSLGQTREGTITQLHTGIHRVSQEEFTSTKITYYGEYGITDKLTIYTSIPYDWQRSNDTLRYAGESGPSGIGDINLGLRYNLAQNLLGQGILMSVQGEVKIPEAYEYGNPLEDLSLGNGQYDVTLYLLFGKGFSKGYSVMHIAYKYSFENTEHDPLTFKPSDQYIVFLHGGYPISSFLWLRGSLSWTKSIGNASVSKELIVANYDYGGERWHRDVVLIKDTLGLEPNILNGTIDLAFNTSPQTQVVLSYSRDLDGFGDLRTKDYALGETFSIAFVYMR